MYAWEYYLVVIFMSLISTLLVGGVAHDDQPTDRSRMGLLLYVLTIGLIVVVGSDRCVESYDSYGHGTTRNAS